MDSPRKGDESDHQAIPIQAVTDSWNDPPSTDEAIFEATSQSGCAGCFPVPKGGFSIFGDRGIHCF